ncbi:MAG: winged helix DNA-binding domain-containing protein [Chloroflexi bacterium]|nr:winged helix DNA-binding domain-containing protein [Chloroflexota bacterium]MCY4246189.1 winged helix DNA-binding domain-containing protein [Chloroflexota bacterium]
MTAPIPVTRDHVKVLSVVKQGLHQPDSDLRRIIERIGLLQMDSVSVVARSHYLVMLARAGLYDRSALDELLTSGFLFETWAHAMCQLPSAHYPWYHAYIQQKRLKESQWQLKRFDIDMQPIIESVLAAIRERGPMSSKEFKSERRGEGGWWNWKPTKVALEYLFDRGELMVSHRVNFQRCYDLSERVLARHQFQLDKTIEDFRRWTIERSLRHIGIGTSSHIADYYRQPKRDAASILNDMRDRGVALPVQVAGWSAPAYIHRDDLPLLQRVQAGEFQPSRTRFLSPFDNLFWDRDRDDMLWDFFYRIEIYTPKAKRVHGYYVMPILHGSELVGRIDPKVDRKAKRLICHNLHLERGVKLNAALVRGLIGAFEEFMAFHGCEDFELGHCNRAPLERRLHKHFS